MLRLDLCMSSAFLLWAYQNNWPPQIQTERWQMCKQNTAGHQDLSLIPTENLQDATAIKYARNCAANNVETARMELEFFRCRQTLHGIFLVHDRQESPQFHQCIIADLLGFLAYQAPTRPLLRDD